MKLSRLASALTFSHLAQIARGNRADADPDDKDKTEQDREDGNVKKSKSKKAEKGDDDKNYADDDNDESTGAEGDPLDGDNDENDDDSKKTKKSKRAAQDDDEDEPNDDDKREMHGNSPVALARQRERQRCAAIFASKASARNPVLAANLAFRTSMTRQEALAVLESTPAAAAVATGGRSARNPDLGSSQSAAPTSRQAIAISWDTAMKKARG